MDGTPRFSGAKIKEIKYDKYHGVPNTRAPFPRMGINPGFASHILFLWGPPNMTILSCWGNIVAYDIFARYDYLKTNVIFNHFLK